MCGIAGIIGGDTSEHEQVLRAQLECQHHRGPDAAGSYRRGTGSIGQNRLSIIDVEGGDPPITDEDGEIGVVLNGEIYNFADLRDELTAHGHRFATRCDTEVIAHLAETLSPVEIARRLDGMFTFAIWDARRERLLLGRDRFGKKPLHYCWHDGVLTFASEIKGVLANPRVPRQLDPAAIPAYLTFGYVPTPGTFFSAIRSVPPGHVLTLERDGTPRLECYWELPVRTRSALEPVPSFAEATAEVRRLLEDAVRRRLVSDVPVGAFLSGGIDSSAIVATMARLTDEPVATFTIGFDDRDGFDERPFARAIAERYRTDHHEFVVQPNAVDLVEQLVESHDQPFGDSSAVPTYLLSELTRGHVTVALCGDGGDELFAGYERFAAGLAAQHVAQLPRPLRDLTGRSIDRLPPSLAAGRAGNLQRFWRVADRGLPDAYRHWVSFIGEDTRERLLGGPAPGAHDAYASAWQATRGQTLDRLLALNLRTYLVDDLLVKADRMSMAHGLEVRSPFLDLGLAEYATRLPPGYKARGLALKRVLKHAVRDELPPEIRRRRKRGFGVPLDRWFRTDLETYVTDTLGSPEARVREHLRGEEVDALLAGHRSRRIDCGGALWTLLTLEVFLRRHGW